MLGLKLYFERKPGLNDSEIEEVLKDRFNKIIIPEDKTSMGRSRKYLFKDYEVVYGRKRIPVEGSILFRDEPGINWGDIQTSLKQTEDRYWIESILKVCNYEVLLIDAMSRDLPYRRRLEWFQKFVSTVIEQMKPRLIWNATSEQLLETNQFLENSSRFDYQDLNSFVSMRDYDVQDSDSEKYMDTLGLYAFGLTDLEIRFDESVRLEVTKVLKRSMRYVYENKVKLKGEEVILEDLADKWKGHVVETISEPRRRVIRLEYGG